VARPFKQSRVGDQHLKTVKALAVPPSLLARDDKVIE
jgi:hypothetical protein